MLPHPSFICQQQDSEPKLFLIFYFTSILNYWTLAVPIPGSNFPQIFHQFKPRMLNYCANSQFMCQKMKPEISPSQFVILTQNMEKICKFVRCQFSWRVQHKSTHCLHSLLMNQSHLLFSFQVPDHFLDFDANILNILNNWIERDDEGYSLASFSGMMTHLLIEFS